MSDRPGGGFEAILSSVSEPREPGFRCYRRLFWQRNRDRHFRSEKKRRLDSRSKKIRKHAGSIPKSVKPTLPTGTETKTRTSRAYGPAPSLCRRIGTTLKSNAIYVPRIRMMRFEIRDSLSDRA